jgi:hypothetical protein
VTNDSGVKIYIYKIIQVIPNVTHRYKDNEHLKLGHAGNQTNKHLQFAKLIVF